MGNKRVPYEEVFSGRVTSRDKKLMKDSGYTVRDAVSFFLSVRSSPEKALLVDKHFIQENDEIDSLKMDVIAEEMKLEEINKKLGIIELNGKEYSLEVSQAVDRIIQRYSRTSYDLDSYFQSKHTFVENQAAVVDMEVDELMDLVRKKVCKQG